MSGLEHAYDPPLAPSRLQEIARVLGARVVDLREQRRMNRYQLAQRSGLAYSNLAQIEAGLHLPRLGAALQLVAALDLCSIDELFGPALPLQRLLAADRVQ